MEGYIRKRGDKWYYSFEIPSVDGKRKRIENIGGKTKKAAQELLAIALAEYAKTGTIVINSKDTFDKVYNNFIATEGNMTRKFTTLKRFNSIYKNHFKDHFGAKLIGQITSENIQTFLSEKRNSHSAEYVRSMNNILFVIFSFAKRMNKIKINPMLDVIPPPKPKESDIEIYTDKQIEILKTRLESTNVKPAFMIGLHLGLRASECYALRWSDVDFDKLTIKIDKQLQDQNKIWAFTTLKTKNSYRKIIFSESFKEYLLTLKEKSDLSKKHFETLYRTNKVMDQISGTNKIIEVDDFINVKPGGDMLTPYSHKVISRIAKKEFDIDFKFHNLRHTHATKLLEQGMNPMYVQKRLGHAKLEFTLRIYTHITSNMDEQASNILNSMFKD